MSSLRKLQRQERDIEIAKTTLLLTRSQLNQGSEPLPDPTKDEAFMKQSYRQQLQENVPQKKLKSSMQKLSHRYKQLTRQAKFAS
jgi:hypothetical protein